MATNNIQETLDHILQELKSADSTRHREAIQELSQLNFSSEAIVVQLERLVLRGDSDIQKMALSALSFGTSRTVAATRSPHTMSSRTWILKEIDKWQNDELIEPHQAEVLRRHYDFDIAPKTPIVPILDKAQKEDQAPLSESKREQAERKQDLLDTAHPSLMQTLLSEASIKIYLYLGAFFVIASALILAALVEAVRLPILVIATLLFGGAATAMRKRLPQPSFALFIVFSFLLPIDANVIKETLSFHEPALSIYWTILFLLMAVIWGFSVWFYESRFFSVVAFLSLGLAFYRAGGILHTEVELQIFLVMLVSLVGLAGTSLLRKWKNEPFSLPLFLYVQLQVLGVLLSSLTFAALHLFGSDISHGWWLLITLTWLTAASFYALSDLLTPTFFFPWMVVAVLFPLPWFFLKTFQVTQPIYGFGFWSWGAVFAVASEAALRFTDAKIKKYFWALLGGSAFLFLTSFTIATDWDEPSFTCIVFALTAMIYTGLHLVRRRWYVWSAGLLSVLFAYFAFFSLPFIARLEVPLVYQFLVASILLLAPELFTKSPLFLKSESRWPAVALGVFVSIFGIVLAVTDIEHTGHGALALMIYSLLLTLHAFHGKREWLGYFAVAGESLAIVYALDHFKLNLWLPALTALSLLYYAAGFFVRRNESERKAWGDVLIHSGLTLGALLALGSLVLGKETSGWYILLVALLFVVEMLAVQLAWLELAVEILLSLSLYQILKDFDVTRMEHLLFGTSLIWLGCDLTFHFFLKGRKTSRTIVLAIGSALVLATTLILLMEQDLLAPTIYFFLYAFFFGAYGILRKAVYSGYIAAAFLSLSIIKLCEILNFEKWIFPLIVLAMLYYGLGFWLRRKRQADGWNQMLLYSGLGLAVLTSVAAPIQGGLDASIPIAIAATLFACEGFALRNVWWALPADALYLMCYFMILTELNVHEPQYYSIGSALLGMLMHHLLMRAGSKTGTFIAGMLSQLVLLGTTYIQMVSTEKLSFFIVLFIQSMLVLVYGLLQRSRSLVITPIAFAVLGVITVVYSALKGLGPVILIGSTGLVLLMAGIVAVLMRERITKLGEQLSGWRP